MLQAVWQEQYHTKPQAASYFAQWELGPRSVGRLSIVVLALLISHCAADPAAAQTAPAKPEPIAYELKPYRVRVAVAFARNPLLTAAYRGQVLNELSAAIQRTTCGQWKTHVEESAEIVPADRLGLERMKAEDFSSPEDKDEEEEENDEPVAPPEFDKQFFLTVNVRGAMSVVAGREWDELTQELGPIAEAQSLDRRLVPELLFGLLSEMFHPHLAVEEADVARKVVTLKLRGGAYVPEGIAEDPDAEILRVQIRPGSVLVPFFRYHNKNGSVRQVQFLPWTYLVVQSVERGRVTTELVTGIRTPLGAKTSKRVHSLAVGTRVRYPSTMLQMHLRNNPRKKLAGHYVTASVEKYPSQENPSPELFKRMTDRLGRLEIPVLPEHDIVWLRIHSGNALLALVPFAPGLAAESILELPDDSIRLAVEGDLTQVKARLVDTVARRAALMVRARKYAEQKDWKKVDEEMAKLDELPSIAEFRDQISGIRVPALEAARRQNSRLTQRKVQQMCETANALIEKYLSEERINLLKEDIRERRPAK